MAACCAGAALLACTPSAGHGHRQVTSREHGCFAAPGQHCSPALPLQGMGTDRSEVGSKTACCARRGLSLSTLSAAGQKHRQVRSRQLDCLLRPLGQPSLPPLPCAALGMGTDVGKCSRILPSRCPHLKAAIAARDKL